MNLKPVNIAVVDKNTIVKADVLRSEKIGSAVKIKAIPNAKYILAEGENGVAPENITLKRVGKDLFIMLEGTDEDQPQLIIEDYFDNPGELVGNPTDRSSEIDYIKQPELNGDIELKGITFSYPAPPMQPNPDILKGVNLTIKPGERVAIVGKIGSGKSTLLRIIARLYTPVKGQIFSSGLDVNQIEPSDWRNNVGFVGQDARLFYGTLRENIMIGRQNASSDEFLKVLRLTGLDHIAARHPRGIHMPVGEQGNSLSGGQRQLVSLARTLLARPNLLLLDEPTSAMDAQTEALFLQHLKIATAGHTLVVVTHRPSLLALVDRMVIIEDGKIVADGPKQQILAALNGTPKAQPEQTPANDSTPAQAVPVKEQAEASA